MLLFKAEGGELLNRGITDLRYQLIYLKIGIQKPK